MTLLNLISITYPNPAEGNLPQYFSIKNQRFLHLMPDDFFKSYPNLG